MKAIRVHEHGAAEAMRWEEIDDPKAGPHDAVVALEAIGVNFIDVYFRSGQYKVPSLPFTPGTEGAGRVVAVGAEVDSVRVGDRVGSTSFVGTYAEKACVPAERLVPIPEGLSSELVAASLLQGMTAHYLAHSTYPLKPGDRCLIHAAAGGVGLLLCQMARRCGAFVLGLVSSEEKAALARGAGAHDVILNTREDWAEEVARLSGGEGLDVVYDSVGKATFEASLRCLAPRGMLVLYGQSSGAVPPFDPQVLARHGSLFLTRPVLGHYTLTREDLMRRAGELFSAIVAQELEVRIGDSLPLAEAAEAHCRLESRRTTGKVLLVP